MLRAETPLRLEGARRSTDRRSVLKKNGCGSYRLSEHPRLQNVDTATPTPKFREAIENPAVGYLTFRTV